MGESLDCLPACLCLPAAHHTPSRRILLLQPAMSASCVTNQHQHPTTAMAAAAGGGMIRAKKASHSDYPRLPAGSAPSLCCCKQSMPSTASHLNAPPHPQQNSCTRFWRGGSARACGRPWCSTTTARCWGPLPCPPPPPPPPPRRLHHQEQEHEQGGQQQQEGRSSRRGCWRMRTSYRPRRMPGRRR